MVVRLAKTRKTVAVDLIFLSVVMTCGDLKLATPFIRICEITIPPSCGVAYYQSFGAQLLMRGCLRYRKAEGSSEAWLASQDRARTQVTCVSSFRRWYEGCV